MTSDYKDFAKVAERLDGYTFVINRGSSDGVDVGHRYLVFRLGDNIIDPDTGEDLGVLEIVKGRAIVTHIQEKIATLESNENETIPGQRRKIRRNPGVGFLGLINGPREEEIEEGVEVKRRTINVEVGDIVKPI